MALTDDRSKTTLNRVDINLDKINGREFDDGFHAGFELTSREAYYIDDLLSDLGAFDEVGKILVGDIGGDLTSAGFAWNPHTEFLNALLAIFDVDTPITADEDVAFVSLRPVDGVDPETGEPYTEEALANLSVLLQDQSEWEPIEADVRFKNGKIKVSIHNSGAPMSIVFDVEGSGEVLDMLRAQE